MEDEETGKPDVDRDEALSSALDAIIGLSDADIPSPQDNVEIALGDSPAAGDEQGSVELDLGSDDSPPGGEGEKPEGSSTASSGVDFSSLAFGSQAPLDSASTTTHSSSVHSRETVNQGTGGAGKVQVVNADHAVEVSRLNAEDTESQGERPSSPDIDELGDGDALASLFDGGGAAVGTSSGRRKVAPPRVGNKGGDWDLGFDEADSEPEPDESLESQEPEGELNPAVPPAGNWTAISQEDWDRLTTKDKDRVLGLAQEMRKMDADPTYFEWFELSHESPPAALKKAYFKLARRYHPDALVDEAEAFRSVATALFARVSEAYEVLADEESRDKYVRKHIHGEKDEEELAMEQVQVVLAAEASFKNGLQLLNAGKVGDAMRHFKSAVDGYPDEAEYVAYYGYTLFRSRIGSDPVGAEDGVELLEKAMELKPAAFKPYQLMGKVSLQKGDARAAKNWLRKSLKINPDNPEAVRDYRRADEMDKAAAAGEPTEAESSKGLKGFFGRFKGGKKKAVEEKPEFNPEDFLVKDGD